MIVTVTLNPSVDRRICVPQLALGRVQRAVSAHASAGGKGLNVARVVRQLGEEVAATGFLGGRNGEWIAKKLEQDGISGRFASIAGETRSCLNLIDLSDGSSTEVLEPGPEVTEEEMAALLDRIRELAAPETWMIVSGSLPGKCPPDYCGRLVEIASSRGARVVLDSSGEALRSGMLAGPYAIKPNEEEFLQLTGADRFSEERLAALADDLRRRGVRHTIVSLGSEGCAAMLGARLYRAKPPRVKAVNPVGSGDAFVAGLVVAWRRGADDSGALRFAAAVGAANALSEATGDVRQADIKALCERVAVSRL
ncbi:1-phosphofructokinase [Paenibacillus sp. MWE-103]|uniref:Tagatose-6-phosphate kinase n=1 Tax=Paenibacillus artemisiicola TaxID=1172618 RepID=A0ABS3WJ41_9BACL|nr:1-phosphofructokinase [Paenibacillus artemisiicola]